MMHEQISSFGARLELIQASSDPRERIRLIDEELDAYDDGTEEVDLVPPRPQPRWRTLLASDTASGELFAMVMNLFWGVSLIFNSSLFDSTPSLYNGNAKLADEWFWGIILLGAFGAHVLGYLHRAMRLRVVGVGLYACVWAIAAFAQLGSDTFSPSPFALCLILLWLFVRLPMREE